MRSIHRNACLIASLLLSTVGCKSSTTQEAAPPEPVASPTMAPFAGEVGMGISYLQTRAADFVDATEVLYKAIEANNIEAAKRAYCDARAPYEEIEVMAPIFPELHRSIDARPHEFVNGELSDDFRGFHRIETYLFARDAVEPALPYAKQLVEDAEDLQAVLADRALFDAKTSFDAMLQRCNDIATRTITSEEEIWSDQSLLVIRHGWIGVHSQYRHFARDLREKDVALAERLDRGYRKAMESIATDFTIGETKAAPYSIIGSRKRREIADHTIRLRMYIEAAMNALELDDMN